MAEIKFIPMFDLLKGLKDLEYAAINANQALLPQLGAQLLTDIKHVEPKTPVDTGNLIESGYHEVQGSAVFVGFRVPYAVWPHENLRSDINWTRPGSGPKFISAKLTNPALQDKYRKTTAQAIGDSLRRAFRRFRGGKSTRSDG